MEDKQIAVVLGGTTPHIELVKNLKQRNYHVILVDYLKEPPAKAYADEHIMESTLDKEKVLEIASNKKAHLVISTCIDQANATACYVSEKLRLTYPYTFETAINVTNKKFMKKIFSDNRIPTARYYTITSLSELDVECLCFPVVVKPVDCNSSKGVRRANNTEELREYALQAIKLSQTGNAVVEEFQEGFEIQVDCFAENTSVKVLMTRSKKKIHSNSGMVLNSYGSIIPAPLSEQAIKEVVRIANQIAAAFCLTNTPFFFQAIVNGDQVSVLEFAPRIGGGLSTYLINTITGFDLLDATVDSYLNIPVRVTSRNNAKHFSTNLLYTRSGVLHEISGLSELKNKGNIKEFFVYKKPGTVIDDDISSGNRVGAFILEADTQEELEKNTLDAIRKIRVLDIDDNDILRREIYERK